MLGAAVQQQWLQLSAQVWGFFSTRCMGCTTQSSQKYFKLLHLHAVLHMPFRMLLRCTVGRTLHACTIGVGGLNVLNGSCFPQAATHVCSKVARLTQYGMQGLQARTCIHV
jgi:hypothetical protein